jgi:hypothetical protein
VSVVGLDFEGCNEATADAAVERAWYCAGDGMDALVNCHSYEGIPRFRMVHAHKAC